MAYLHLATVTIYAWVEGWNDASNGPLLPRMQQVYHVGYAVVSLIFVFSCIGFICGAIANVFMSERLGFGKVSACAFLQVVGYSIQAAAPPFPAFVLGYFVNGFGMALQNAQATGYTARIGQNTALNMAILTSVSAGALVCPFVATEFSQLPQWSFHFLTSVGLSLFNLVALVAVFRLKNQEECLAQIGRTVEEKGTSDRNELRQIFKLKEVHLLALFVMFYSGTGVTIGGWTVTYIIDVRGGGSHSGYISAGYFGGLLLGRFAFLKVNKKLGERLALVIYATVAIALECIVWFVPSIAGDAVAVAVIGLLMGPVYPVSLNYATKVLPRWLLTGAIGWIAGVGQAGTALFPFITGAIASKAGIKTMQPVVVASLASMIGLWLLVPKSSRRHD
ncbi:MFS general substrate transporter [Coniophora puteana RWD-64-598 SS2]|uniref:MFS general substrate transporter n=1 Tax=Coniophora puteana (strain RWD-64-598) TaxID=741705 RepID=A0A5M3MHA0_CONPW|nr:MFS general substrate transporter [Coniophora puteana RWD-64-598 SS2]EIW78483.1 MFS general substrate transporter [Coniophora puteana RWD-64-598 SS2]